MKYVTTGIAFALALVMLAFISVCYLLGGLYMLFGVGFLSGKEGVVALTEWMGEQVEWFKVRK